jgi:hypothetical protein
MSYIKANIMVSIIVVLVFSCEKSQVVEPIVESQPQVTVVNRDNIFSVTAYVRDTTFTIGKYLSFQSDSILYDFAIGDYSAGSVNVFLNGKYQRYSPDYIREDHISSDTSIQDIRSIGCKPHSVAITFYNFCGNLSMKIKAMPTNLFKRIHGSWNWILSSGGDIGGVFTPETEGYTIVYTFNSADSSLVCYRADAVLYSGRYSIDEANWILQISSTYLNGGNSYFILYLNHDTLYLRRNVTDVPTQIFVRIP